MPLVQLVFFNFLGGASAAAFVAPPAERTWAFGARSSTWVFDMRPTTWTFPPDR